MAVRNVLGHSNSLSIPLQCSASVCALQGPGWPVCINSLRISSARHTQRRGQAGDMLRLLPLRLSITGIDNVIHWHFMQNTWPSSL